MPSYQADSGIEWYYDVEGEGESLLFIHGWGVDRRIWRQQAKYFAQFYRVISVDLPGHGKSSWKKVTLEVIARDLFLLLEHIQMKEMSVIGSSLGGMVALKLYILCPNKFTRIIFVGSMPKFCKTPDYPYGLDMDKLHKLCRQLNTDYPTIVHIFFRSLFTLEERRTRRFKWLQKFRQTAEVPVKQALVDYLDILQQEDLRDVLKTVAVPVQFINGRGDQICDASTVSFLRELMPTARFDFFEDCGHFPFLSKPHEFNQLLGEFLNDGTRIS